MRIAISLALVLLLACSRGDAQTPAMPAPAQTLKHYDIRPEQLPKPYATANEATISRVSGNPRNARIVLPPRFSISIWAENLADPRNMIQAPNGDVLVACTSGLEIVVLRDANNDGKPEGRWTFADGLNRPFGLALRGNHLYVGNTDAVVRFNYTAGQTEAKGDPVTLVPLPRGGHSTRNVIFNRDGSKMFIAVGSASNVDDESADPRRAAITVANPDGSDRRIFASGLRNPIGIAWNPVNQTLWTVVNERDGLGDELVPDYLTEVKQGAFYGWPFSYIGKNVDPRRRGEHPELVAKTVVPSLLFASHSAPINFAFYTGTMFPEKYRNGAFVAMHGSWNRSKLTGYKVVHVPFRNGQPAGGYDDFAVGWIAHPDGREVYGRPAGVLVLRDGSLLIADDGSNVIWRITYR